MGARHRGPPARDTCDDRRPREFNSYQVSWATAVSHFGGGHGPHCMPQRPEPHRPSSQPHSAVAQAGSASAPWLCPTCAAKRLSFLTTLVLSHEGQATFVSDRMRSSNDPLQSLHSYSYIGIVFYSRASPRQITRILLYRPSPSLIVSMSP